MASDQPPCGHSRRYRTLFIRPRRRSENVSGEGILDHELQEQSVDQTLQRDKEKSHSRVRRCHKDPQGKISLQRYHDPGCVREDAHPAEPVIQMIEVRYNGKFLGSPILAGRAKSAFETLLEELVRHGHVKRHQR